MTSKMAAAWILIFTSCAKSPSRDSSPTASARPPAMYVAIGDSFTIGTGTSPEAAFPSRLREHWKGTSLRNLAVNGFTTRDVLERELPELPTIHPDFATLAIGANDIAHGDSIETYRDRLRSIFRELTKAVPACRIVVLPQPDWSPSPAAKPFGDPATLKQSIDAFNATLREESTAAGARYLDLTPLMQTQAAQGMLAPDRLHPNAQAHAQWATAIAESLAESPLPDSCPLRSK